MYKIIASDIEEFKKIENLLNTLPEKILEQIDIAEFNGWVKCTIKILPITLNRIILPEDTFVISSDKNENYISVTTESQKFFFRIERSDGGNILECAIEYTILK